MIFCYLLIVGLIVSVVFLGYPYWSLSNFIKGKVNGAQKYVKRFQKVATEFAHHKGYDGVICGHIHQAALDESEQGIYGNCGDWIESCTFLVENKEGNIELMHWADQKLRLSLCQTEICSGSSLIEESPNKAA